MITTGKVTASVSCKELTRVFDKSYELLYVLKHKPSITCKCWLWSVGVGHVLVLLQELFIELNIEALLSKYFYSETCKHL